MSDHPGAQSLLFSHVTLRRLVGILGIVFPFAVTAGYPHILRSISDYYYTDTRDVFVGTLWVIGFFLFAYRGYERKDTIAGGLACLFAIGTSVFPADPDPRGPVIRCATPHAYFHYWSAMLLFLTLSYFSLVLFTRASGNPAPQKRKRNWVYRICGWTMLAGIVTIAVTKLVFQNPENAGPIPHPVFWLEALTIEAFGVSWIVKGAAILKDLPRVDEQDAHT